MKPTWTKVYSGPGYPIDPAKESKRNAVPMQDFIPLHPKDVMNKLLQGIIDGSIKPEKAVIVGVDPGASEGDISVLSPIDQEYSCVMVSPKKSIAQEISDGAFNFMNEVYSAAYRHQRRYAMIMTEDFQSRLMAIEVKERGM